MFELCSNAESYKILQNVKQKIKRLNINTMDACGTTLKKSNEDFINGMEKKKKRNLLILNSSEVLLFSMAAMVVYLFTS